MVRAGRIVGVLTAVVLLASCTDETPQADVVNDTVEQIIDQASEYVGTELFSIEDWLNLSDDKHRVLIDLRKPDAFAEGHIPGAKRVWRDDIQSVNYPYGGMALESGIMTDLLDSMGVTSASEVYIYDAKGGCDAARLWWLMKVYGHDQVYLLDGGWQAWQLLGADIPETSDAAELVPTCREAADAYAFPTPADSTMVATLEDVQRAIDDPNIILLDTRSTDEFTGVFMKPGAVRAGHIPGALHFDWGNAVQMDSDWKMKPRKDLLAMLEAVGVTADDHIITYCHTGVRSAHTTFVLRELLGFTNVQNYDGSWTEWSHIAELPIENNPSGAVAP